MSDEPEVARHYSAQYSQFADDLHARIRRLAFGEDIGQNSWLTVEELERFASRLDLEAIENGEPTTDAVHEAMGPYSRGSVKNIIA